nr:leucine-rich repeat-containing protein 40-like [Aedes albopictus]
MLADSKDMRIAKTFFVELVHCSDYNAFKNIFEMFCVYYLTPDDSEKEQSLQSVKHDEAFWKILDLSHNKFIELPETIATFENLTHLYLQNNQLKSISMHIFADMRRLALLYLQANHISRTTGDLKLPRLSELWLNSNRLEQLDVSRWYLPALIKIDLDRNHLKSVIGFVECFGGAHVISLAEGPWDCSWLGEVGRSIRGMYISYERKNSSLSCSGNRYSITERSLVETPCLKRLELENKKLQLEAEVLEESFRLREEIDREGRSDTGGVYSQQSSRSKVEEWQKKQEEIMSSTIAASAEIPSESTANRRDCEAFASKQFVNRFLGSEYVKTFFQLLYCAFQIHYDKTYDLFNATWTSNLSKPPEGVQEIRFIDVDVPDSSSSILTQVLDEVESFSLFRSAISRIYLPVGLLKLRIVEPVKPIEIVIASDKSYRLTEIAISHFDKMPTQISRLQSLEHFFCMFTPVLELDFELFAKMENLTTFDMVRTSTKDIHFSKPRQFPLLQKFDVSKNHLTTLNATSLNFPSLEELDLSFNKFIEVPKEVATLENLARLYLQSNQIECIDFNTFSEMRRLDILLLHDNHISRITGELQLPRLSKLRLDENRLEELNVSRWHLPALNNIFLGQNLLKSVIGFTECFGGVPFIFLTLGQWNCSWLEEIGRSIRGMNIQYVNENSSLRCYGIRNGMSRRSTVRNFVNGKLQVRTL